MQCTCVHPFCMSTMVQIRNVPPELHRKLKVRAAMAGMSLSEYALAALRRSLERPSRDELLARLASRAEVKPKPAPAQAVRAERQRR